MPVGNSSKSIMQELLDIDNNEVMMFNKSQKSENSNSNKSVKFEDDDD